VCVRHSQQLFCLRFIAEKRHTIRPPTKDYGSEPDFFVVHASPDKTRFARNSHAVMVHEWRTSSVLAQCVGFVGHMHDFKTIVTADGVVLIYHLQAPHSPTTCMPKCLFDVDSSCMINLKKKQGFPRFVLVLANC